MNNISECSEGVLLGLNWWHLGSWIGKVPRDAQELHRLKELQKTRNIWRFLFLQINLFYRWIGCFDCLLTICTKTNKQIYILGFEILNQHLFCFGWEMTLSWPIILLFSLSLSLLLSSIYHCHKSEGNTSRITNKVWCFSYAFFCWKDKNCHVFPVIFRQVQSNFDPF